MGVKLEIFRMVLYLSFPVTMFWLANQANYFEEYIVTRKRQIFPPEQADMWKEIEAQREQLRQQKYEMQNNMK